MSDIVPTTSLLALTASAQKVQPNYAADDAFRRHLDSLTQSERPEPPQASRQTDRKRDDDPKTKSRADDKPSDAAAENASKAEDGRNTESASDSDQASLDTAPNQKQDESADSDDVVSEESSLDSPESHFTFKSTENLVVDVVAKVAPTEDFVLTPVDEAAIVTAGVLSDEESKLTQLASSTTSTELAAGSKSDSLTLAPSEGSEFSGDQSAEGKPSLDADPDSLAQKVGQTEAADSETLLDSAVIDQETLSSPEELAAITSRQDRTDDKSAKHAEQRVVAPSSESSAITTAAIQVEKSGEVSSEVELTTSSPLERSAAIGDQSTRPETLEQTSKSERSTEQRPAVDPARFVSRVARAFEAAERRGGGPIELRLSPPELGSMQLKLEVREGVLTASIETETQAARNALLDNLPALRERLAEQEIRVEKFDVDVRQEGGERQTEADRDASGRSDTDDESQEASDLRSEEVTVDQNTVRPSIDFGDDRINLVA